MENGNQPINPCVIEQNIREEFIGLTKREYFAGVALRTMNPTGYRNMLNSGSGNWAAMMAEDAVYMADMLLKQLEKPTK